MKVRMTQTLNGSIDGRAYPPKGEEFEVPDVAGANLCSRGYAEPVADRKTEKAVPRKRTEKRG